MVDWDACMQRGARGFESGGGSSGGARSSIGDEEPGIYLLLCNHRCEVVLGCNHLEKRGLV
jgi:hypothetical protein